MTQVGIVTQRGDLHALFVKAYLESRRRIRCHILESDHISGQPMLTWSVSTQSHGEAHIKLSRRTFLASELDALWWRRAPGVQVGSTDADSEVGEAIDRDCDACLLGALLCSFRGHWISHPTATALAANKLVQLQLARRCGFVIHDTLITQDLTAVTDFARSHADGVIVKAIRGPRKRTLFTRLLSSEHIASQFETAAAPAIYQELITGIEHIRFVCFGDRVWLFRIESEALDWREDSRPTIALMEATDQLSDSIRRVIGCMGLRMGIGDLKIDKHGQPVWLEINPQGQFLFLQEATGVNLAVEFAEWILDEAVGPVTA
jgi:glutathione synthase/RimK-type ligase-like ATP-grasp enzyme